MSLSKRCYEVSENLRFQNFILMLIVVTALTSGIGTFDFGELYGLSIINAALSTLDTIILNIFIIELLIRLIGHGYKFFKDPWNNFDFIIIVVSLAPSTGALSTLRVFRVFRALRLVSSMPEMQRMTEAILRSIRGILAITWLLGIVWYVFSVLGTMLFSEAGQYGEEYFGNLGLSMYTLFQIMTLESWSHGIARLIIADQGWWAAAFFVTYIISTSFTFLNMFIAVFTNTMASIDIEDGDELGFSSIASELKKEIRELKSMIKDLEKSEE